jgi:nanoRNase/pAp phosphatase (c-di-AMP/oligoRNAs hydrolase)
LRSFGTDKKKQVHLVAKKYFDGGGHFNAAGGNLGNILSNLNLETALLKIEEKLKI